MNEGITYPYELIRIESKEDPRKIELGTLNLKEVFNKGQEQMKICVDNAIVKEVYQNKVELIFFKKGIEQSHYVLQKNAQRELEKLNIKKGDLVSVNIDKNLSEIENVRKTNTAIEKVTIHKISEKNSTITIGINKQTFVIHYKKEIYDKLVDLALDSTYLVKLEKEGDYIYLTEIMGV